MELPAALTVEEVTRLQRCINDLVSVLALPVLCSGRSPSEMIGSFLDGLVRILHLDVAYARLIMEDGATSQHLRLPPDTQLEWSAACQWFAALEDDPAVWPRQMALGPSGAPIAIEALLLGLYPGRGVVAAGSRHPGFPLQTEQLLLSVATNQLLLGVQASTHSALVEIKHSQARLQRVLDTIPVIAWCNMPDGPNEFLNQRWCEYTGMAQEESLGWGWQAAFHPEDLPPLMTRWREMIASGESAEIAARIRRHDGVYRWFLIRAAPLFNEANEIVRWYGTSTDIDDRKRAEEALLTSKRELGHIVNTIPALAWSARPDGSAEFFSDHFLAYVGLPAEQMLGRGWKDIVHPDDLERLVTVWQSAVAAGKPEEAEARLRRFDGEYRWFLFRTNPMLDASGKVVKWYGVNTDIHDRRQAEEDLSKAHTELASVARVTSLGMLTASIAHEVNQPLSGIITNANTCLRMLTAQPPNINGALETARRTIRDGERAANVIARLRTLYSRKDPRLAPVDLNDTIREVVSLSLGELQRNQVILRQELAEGLPTVGGDRIQLQQVIFNLLRNASDAMCAIEDRPRELLIRTEPDSQGAVRLSVSDVGVGLTPQALQKIFEPFYTTKSDGMGIGLSVSRSIIEAHRGRLWATPNESAGVTFTFSLPP